MGLIFLRKNDAVREDVLDERRIHRAGKTQIAHLHRRRAPGENAASNPPSVAIEVDCYIDLQFTQELRNGGIAHTVGMNEAVEGAFHPDAQRASVCGLKRDCNGFEAAPVMVLEATDDQCRHGMHAKVRRKIGYADFIVTIALPLP